MANIIRGALTVTGEQLVLLTQGFSYIGLGLTGTWAGTVTTFFSQDGVSYANNPLSMTPFASGTPVTKMTANGTWFAVGTGIQGFKINFARTSGTLIAALSASNDASFQNAFLADSLLYVNSVQTHATNTLTQAARTNAAWRLRTLVITTAGTITWAANPVIQIKDGTTLLWGLDIPTTAGVYAINLPADPNVPGYVGGGLVNTPGNAMSVVVADGGSAVITNINAEFSVA